MTNALISKRESAKCWWKISCQLRGPEIDDDLPLSGAGDGSGFRDALQLVVALDKTYGSKLPTPKWHERLCRASTPSPPRWKST